MVNDHSDKRKTNLFLPRHGLVFLISNRDVLYAPSHRQDNRCPRHGDTSEDLNRIKDIIMKALY